MGTFSKLSVLIDDLAPALDAFYKVMLSDPRFRDFFEDDHQVQRLLVKQKQEFEQNIQRGREELRQHQLWLGSLHYRLKIPYADFLRGTEILHEFLIKAAQARNLQGDVYETLFEYTRFTSNNVAKGYLDCILQQDIEDLQSFISFLDAHPSPSSHQCAQDLTWIEELIRAVYEEDDSQLKRREGGLLRIPGDGDDKSGNLLESTTTRIRRDIESIFYFLNVGSYQNVLPLYTSLLNVYKVILFSGQTLGWSENLRLTQKAVNLELSASELKVLAGMMAHDLKNPLESIINLGELIAHDGDQALEADRKTYADLIVDVASQMNALIDALADYTRASARSLNLKAIPLGELVDDVCSRLRHIISQSSAAIRIASPETKLFVDPIMFTSVLQNLVSNAINHSPNTDLVINISAHGRQDKTLVVVSDNGVGIATTDLEKVFQSFYRSSGYHSGSGLGLTFARMMVEKHGGHCWIESELGQGTSVFLELPAATVSAALPMTGRPSHPIGAASSI